MNPSEEASRYLEPGFGAALAIWWAWTWRWLLYAAAGNFVLYVPLMGISLIMGGTHTATNVVNFLGGVFLICAAQTYTLWNLFGTEVQDFELWLEAKEKTGSDPLFAPTLRDAMRIWWVWFWRQFVITFGLSIVLGFVLGFAGSAAGFSVADLRTAAIVLNLVLVVATTFFVVYLLLRHDFRSFRIRLVRSSTL